MICYSTEPMNQIFIKDYGFFSFPKNMSKNISKILSGKYSQVLLNHAKQSATDTLKTT